MNKKMLKSFSPLILTTRFKGFKHTDGIRYPGGIIYYPRNPDHKEPECTPAKLFRVERIKTTKHQPWWQKLTLRDFKIDEENRVTVVKNIPEINAKLWSIKHLIKVTPITFPYGEPTDEDIKHTILKENGQCIVTKTLQPQPNRVEALEKFCTDPKKMDSATVKRDSRLKWVHPFGGGF